MIKNSFIRSVGRPIVFLLLQFCFILVKAQEKTVEPPVIVEQQLENLTENNEDVETEDDAYLQEMQHFINDPINLNFADESDLKQLKLLTPLQIQNLISYRTLFGKFISIYELQAVPSWNVNMIKRIRPYITVDDHPDLFSSLRDRLKNGEKTVLARVTQVLERSNGYLVDTSITNSFLSRQSAKIICSL